MNRAIKSSLITLFLILVFTAFIVGVGLIRGDSGNPDRIASWESPPDILICYESQYSYEEVKMALDLWRGLGYKFGDVYDDYDCGDEPLFYSGSIVIGLPSDNYEMDKLGLTRTNIGNASSIIYSSRIEVLSNLERVLEHEIGHALGWDHVNEPGHLMNEFHNHGGWNTKGLEKTTK